MVFSSAIFMFLFLPIVFLMYFGAKERYRNYILLIASLIFYAYGEPKFVFVMLLSIGLNYWSALQIVRSNERQKQKMWLGLAVFGNLSILFLFKYLDFSVLIVNRLFGTAFSPFGIALPIGISFFTFQAMSYVIDVYRGKVQVQTNVCYLALYVSFFPQLVAGPIVRYSTIAQQIEKRMVDLEKFGEGVRRFILGVGKKVLLANNMALVVEEVFSVTGFSGSNALYLWLGSICYSMQIYYDFSGYSDMAIGLGKMFGFAFEENFNYPYISKSATEFWRRWHISLGQWFRDYVYIPLGGSKVGKLRHMINLLAVWFLTGLWHGANYTFIVWGLAYFVLLVLEKFLLKPEQRKNKLFTIGWQIVTLFCVNFGWVIFNSPDLSFALEYCASMLGLCGNSFVLDAAVGKIVRESGAFFVAALLFATPLARWCGEKTDRNEKIKRVKDFVVPVGYLFVLLWSVSYLILGAHNPFIYFNF